MDSFLLALIGVGLATAIASRLRQEIPPSSIQFRQEGLSQASRFQAQTGGIFTTRVVALEFDETGPVMYINGEFYNEGARVDIDFVTADYSAGGQAETFVSFDPSADGEPSETMIGDLINFVSPVWIEHGQGGKFRTPIFAPEREERMAAIIDRLDNAAQRMVDKLDREFGDYSLEGEFLDRLESDFLHDYVVRELVAGMEKEMIWRSGKVDLSIKFLNSYEEIVEDSPLSFQLAPEEAMSLRDNINVIVLNALRVELGLDITGYNAVVYEQ